MNYTHFIVCAICIICLIIFMYIIGLFNYNEKQNNETKKYKIKDNFISQNNDPKYDGKMSFDYLHNLSYTPNILNKYYLNDDFRINNTQLVNHPYQFKPNNYFGNPHFINISNENAKYAVSLDPIKYASNKYSINDIGIVKTKNIYNQYGIRV